MSVTPVLQCRREMPAAVSAANDRPLPQEVLYCGSPAPSDFFCREEEGAIDFYVSKSPPTPPFYKVGEIEFAPSPFPLPQGERVRERVSREIVYAEINKQPANNGVLAGGLLFAGGVGLGILIGGTGGLALIGLGLLLGMSACHPLEEIGDPVDRDGDGYIDKSFGGDDCDDSDENIHPGATEICNGKDDNCDGDIDEGIEERRFYSGPEGTARVGICRPQIEECREGVWTVTQEEMLPQNEICGNADNDCNRDTDETCWLQISAGDRHTCGLKTDGSVACWGFNGNGQSTPPSDTFTQVSAGGFHTCGLKTDSSVACWGSNGKGQSTPPSDTFTQVGAGAGHACAVKTDGSVACWGDNFYGRSTPPSDTFTQVSAGTAYTCGLKTDGSVACWGSNGNGQSTPPSGTFTQVSAGTAYTCGLKTDGSVACWGSSAYGRSTPPSDTFTQVSAGGGHTCAVKTDRSVACWGYNENGQSTPP